MNTQRYRFILVNVWLAAAVLAEGGKFAKAFCIVAALIWLAICLIDANEKTPLTVEPQKPTTDHAK